MPAESDPSPSPPVSSAEHPPRKWVWHSSDASIARGQISVLAVVEIPFAVALFWWITTISPWPWFTVVGLMAAPMLLLRSPASIDEGVAQLRMYWGESDRERSRKELFFIGAVAATVSAGLCYAWAQQWLPGVSAWPLFFRSMLIGAVAVAFAFAFAVAVAVAGAVAVAVAIWLGAARDELIFLLISNESQPFESSAGVAAGSWRRRRSVAYAGCADRTGG